LPWKIAEEAILAAWPELPEAMKAGILATIKDLREQGGKSRCLSVYAYPYMRRLQRSHSPNLYDFDGGPRGSLSLK